MNKVAVLLATLLLLFFTEEKDQGMRSSDTGEKEYLISYLHQTFLDLETSVEGLNEKQMQFKSSEQEWSVSQCLEHIILTEKMLFELVKEQMEKPANPERKKEVRISDEDLINGMKDRSKKVQAPPELQGRGSYIRPEAAMEDLRKNRELILAYIQKFPLDDFRNHISDSPMGAVDAYQSMLFIAGHTARHTLQIEEIKSSEEFPVE